MILIFYDFIPPFSKADKTSKIKLVFIGQDPTVRNEESRKDINVTLNLDRENSLRSYLKKACEILEIDIDSEVYATNLYKCFFKKPPADDKSILTRHFKIWMDFLIHELAVFKHSIFITLGEPLINQLIHSNSKKVKCYWNHVGKTESGMNFKCSEPSENYLQKRIYPIAHQPTWSRNTFYKTYLTEYLEFLKRNENM
jgi:uracil-DNA glycosylase